MVELTRDKVIEALNEDRDFDATKNAFQSATLSPTRRSWTAAPSNGMLQEPE